MFENFANPMLRVWRNYISNLSAKEQKSTTAKSNEKRGRHQFPMRRS